MSTRRKTALILLAILVALVIVLAIVVPALVNLDRYRPETIAYLHEKTGKPVAIGRLALTVFPTLSIRVDDFEIGNPAGFPAGHVVQARRIYAVVDAHALWNKQVVVQSLELDDPDINLLSDPRGRWNYQNPAERAERKAPAATTTPSGGGSSFTMGVISKVKIVGGHLAVANLLPSGRAGEPFFEGRGISSTLDQVDFDAFTAPGSAPAGSGTLQADSLRFGAVEATRVRSKLHLASEQVAFDGLSLDVDGGQATGNLEFNFGGPDTRFGANTRLRGVDVSRALAAFPSGRGKMTGTLEGNVKLAGDIKHSEEPLAGMQGVGQLTVRNGKLPSLKLNQNLMTLARFSDLGPASGDPSSFSLMSADLRLANQRIASNKITVNGNGVDVDGSGTLGLEGTGSLDYQGVAKVAAGQNPISNIVAGLSGATAANGKLSFPFHVGGTPENPKFTLLSKGNINSLTNMVGNPSQTPGQNLQNPSDIVNAIGGLFKKKPPK